MLVPATAAASGRLTESLCGSGAAFIKQSVRSNYCGVYSTGMLLSLLGLPTTRRAALALYGLGRGDPDYPGSGHPEMGEVFARAAGVRRWRWECHRRFDFATVARSLRAHLRRIGRPTLLSFGAVHRNGVWRGRHVVVVVGATDEVIELLDPLGGVPRERAWANVWLRAAERPGKVLVLGNSYGVSHASAAAVLRWAAGPGL